MAALIATAGYVQNSLVLAAAGDAVTSESVQLPPGQYLRVCCGDIKHGKVQTLDPACNRHCLGTVSLPPQLPALDRADRGSSLFGDRTRVLSLDANALLDQGVAPRQFPVQMV